MVFILGLNMFANHMTGKRLSITESNPLYFEPAGSLRRSTSCLWGKPVKIHYICIQDIFGYKPFSLSTLAQAINIEKYESRKASSR